MMKKIFSSCIVYFIAGALCAPESSWGLRRREILLRVLARIIFTWGRQSGGAGTAT
jgi:hypothetical protein